MALKHVLFTLMALQGGDYDMQMGTAFNTSQGCVDAQVAILNKGGQATCKWMKEVENEKGEVTGLTFYSTKQIDGPIEIIGPTVYPDEPDLIVEIR